MTVLAGIRGRAGGDPTESLVGRARGLAICIPLPACVPLTIVTGISPSLQWHEGVPISPGPSHKARGVNSIVDALAVFTSKAGRKFCVASERLPKGYLLNSCRRWSSVRFSPT